MKMKMEVKRSVDLGFLKGPTLLTKNGTVSPTL